ncbi:MAG: hypothetical protein Q8P30_04895 [Candidatus Uhrbacteria bacterium]|nr:hypothetical protein [Candidatus Uhrbacteria bacterium]
MPKSKYGEQGEGGGPKTPEVVEVEPTQTDLAKGWLRFRFYEIEKQIASEKQDLRFNETYQHPPFQGEKGEPGSLDYSDYKKAGLEADSWEYEREDVIDESRRRLDELMIQRAEIKKTLDRVEAGEQDLILELAANEKERQASIAERETRKRELHEGIALEGMEEANESISIIWDLVKAGKVPKYVELSGGWQLVLPGAEQIQFRYKDEDGALKGPVAFIALQQKKGDPIHIWFEDFEGVEEDPKSGGKKVIGEGVMLSFDIYDKVIKKQNVNKAIPQREWGYWEAGISSTNIRFDQNHFDKFRSRLSALQKDIEAIAGSKE